jgi:DNA-binding transcriptional MerR regulator
MDYMNEQIKAGELASRYGVSTRTLRYYEEAGLMQSIRTNDYAYRLYNADNVKRLEQILILRKLNVGIKDIRRIFDASNSETVLEVLGQKVNDIDEEVALLHELKEIVVEFIRQIRQSDFNKAGDVKLLYDKAKEIETHLTAGAYAGNPSPVNRLLEVTGKLEAKAASRLMFPDNILKRLLQNVYFIMGDGIEAADELGRRYGIYVYHTCDHRQKHSQNAAPEYQPELSRDVPDFFALDPADALRREREVVRDYTPMVIMDLIQLTAIHERVICENDIDIDSIIHVVTHAVMVTNDKSREGFIDSYESDIRRRDIPEEEKLQLIGRVNEVWGKGKHENPREAAGYGIKQIYREEGSTVEQTAEQIAEYFGWLD